jgi:hypothetical protein
VYSKPVIERNIARVEERIRRQTENWTFRLRRIDQGVRDEMVEHLKKITDPKTDKFIRELTKTEQGFIDNELAMCQLDFQYFCEGYATIQLASQSDRPEGWDEADDEKSGPARTGKFILNGMQIQLLKKLARLEDLCYEALARGAPVNGILLILHKARQLGASMMWQALMYHRIRFYSHINGLTASIDDTSTQALFRRYERIEDNVPAWMKPVDKRRTRDKGVEYEHDSVIELQSGKQDKDLGKGETWHAVHITECAVFERPEDHFDEGLFAAIPTSIHTLYGMEGTSKGKRGWWYDFVMAVMSGTAEGGAGRFAHYFAPFYMIDIMDDARGQRSKYRIEAPVDWLPSVSTQLMARRAKATSPDFCDGREVELHRDVLYWYESTRNYFYKRGKLNVFLQNYPVDPHESFQHSSAGAFSSETIERLENNTALFRAWPYVICTEDELPEREVIAQQDARLQIYNVGGYHLAPMHSSELDKDSRGVIFLYEQPSEQWHYVMGCDPTGGIPGWRRSFRQHNDINTDNGAIEIFRRGRPATPCADCNGKGWKPTTSAGITVECQKCDGRGRMNGRAIQVCEFAAPVDAEELALYVYVLGRVFRGNSEQEECLAVVESNNTGILTLQKLRTVYNYTNLYQSQTVDAGSTPKYTNGHGFNSSPTSVPILHARSRSVVMRRDVDIRSPHLVKEYSDAIVKITGTGSDSADEIAKAKSTAIVVRERFVVPAGGGRHDDRMIASFLAFWALFDWTESGEGGNEGGYDRPERRVLPNLAARPVTSEEQQQQWNDLVSEYMGEVGLMFDHYPDCAETCTSQHSLEDAELEDDEYEMMYDD